jgi:hypothetical protein
VDEQQPWGRRLALVRDQKERRDRFGAIEIQDQSLESVAIVFLSIQEPGWAGLVIPGQDTEQAPELLATPRLESGEGLATLRLGSRLHLVAR